MKTLKRIFISLAGSTSYFHHIGICLLSAKEELPRFTLELFQSKGTITDKPETTLVFTKEELKELYKAIGTLLRLNEDEKTIEETGDDLLI